MAVNNSRSMNRDFHQGAIDRTYMQLTPDRGGVENLPVERLSWPWYNRVEVHADNPNWEAMFFQNQRPVEITRNPGAGDPRY
jgi:hypothetical protein